MSDFSSEKYYRFLKVKNFEIDDRQSKELKELFEKHNKNNFTNSSIFLKERLQLKKTHFKEKINSVIESLLKSVSVNNNINEKEEKIFFDLLSSYSHRFIEHEKNGLRESLISYGLTPPNAIIDESLKTLDNHLSSILFNARNILKISIDEHNYNVKQNIEKKKNIFWSKHGKEIVYGIITAVISGLILYFIGAI